MSRVNTALTRQVKRAWITKNLLDKTPLQRARAARVYARAKRTCACTWHYSDTLIPSIVSCSVIMQFRSVCKELRSFCKQPRSFAHNFSIGMSSLHSGILRKIVDPLNDVIQCRLYPTTALLPGVVKCSLIGPRGNIAPPAGGIAGRKKHVSV